MRTIVHLSDLHFGRIDARLPEPLLADIGEIAPDLVVVSGDLTQRARSSQFQQAREFLDRLPAPFLVVPGNHDVPLYNVFKRFLAPLDNFRKYISGNTEPHFVDDEIAVVGVNTARSLTFKNGRINSEQVERIRERLQPLPPSVLRVVVTHHPFDLAADVDPGDLLGRAGMAMPTLAELGVDLLLSGHLHTSRSGNTSLHYPIAGFAALVVQAGTATSTRMRGEANSFNVLRLDTAAIEVEQRSWHDPSGGYARMQVERFARQGNGWSAVA